MKTSFIKVKGLKPRVDVFTKKMYSNMSKLWRDATKEFIREALPAIHIDTGMSRSSLVPLARVVRMVTEVKAFNPARKRRTGFTSLEGTYDPNGSRSAAAGERLGEKAFKLNFGSEARPVFVFEFNIKVYQYALNEAEWQSLQRGQEAFLAYLKNNAANYVPKLAEWILPETN